MVAKAADLDGTAMSWWSRTAKYAACGLDRYWVLDPDRWELCVFARQGAVYELVQTMGAEPADVDFAGVARIDLATIIPAE